jgi:hypothetical protein
MEPRGAAACCGCMHLVELFLPADAKFSQTRRALADELSRRFGGMTAFNRAPAKGLFEQDSGRVEDEIIIFEVMTTDFEHEWWRILRARLERDFQQDQILIRASAIERI